jgi:hypothetical protein
MSTADPARASGLSDTYVGAAASEYVKRRPETAA